MTKTQTFNEFNINNDLKRSISDLNYINPTPIQEKAIPIVLEGKDMIGQAQTGTGKTAAFSIPMLEKIDANDKTIQSLILCPTRELAIQVSNEIKKLYKYLEGIKSVPVYGGQSYDIQIRALKKHPQIIIGTPGRIIDLMKRSLLKFEDVKMVILDEADEMLKMGFEEDLVTILEKTPASRQTVMFSATMPQPILKIANKYLKSYEFVQIEAKTITVDRIKQTYYMVKGSEKMDLLIRLFDYNQINNAIVFCNTKKEVDQLVVRLQKEGYITEGLHGDLKQTQRDRVMNSFRNSSVQILVATDVAARGIDVDDVDAVFNYDIPQDEESYVHRIGRTGRAGKEGKSFSFITSRQLYRLKDIEKYIGMKIEKGNIPTVSDIKESNFQQTLNDIKDRIAKSNKVEPNPIITKLEEEGFTKDQIINVLLEFVESTDEKKYNNITHVRGKEKNNKKVVKDKMKSKDSQSVIVYFNAGSKHNIKVPKILSLLGKYKVKRRDIGKIEINKKGTYVELKIKDAKKVTSSGSVNISNKDVSTQIIK